MDRLEAMTVLLAVADAGSFSAAARQLHKPLATVSRKVADLEKHLGARLLSRTTRRLALTDTGQDYVLACRRILNEVQQAEQVAAGEFSTPRGELVMTAPVVFGRLCVLPVFTQFLQAYEKIDVRLLLADCTCIGIDNASAPRKWRFRAGRLPIAVTRRFRLTVSTVEAARDAAIAGVGLSRLLSYQVAQACRDGVLEVVLPEFEPPPIPVSLVYAAQGAREFMPIKLRAFLDFARPKLSAQLDALTLPAM